MEFLPPFLLFFSTAIAQSVVPPDSASIPSRLWSNTKPTYYNDTYLIGNGRIGAAVYCYAQSETLTVNEDSFWDAGPMSRVNPDALSNMPAMQSYIQNSDPVNAYYLASLAYAGTPQSCRNYGWMGMVTIAMNTSSTANNYERYLDLNGSTAGLYYVNGETAYFREYIASNPANVLAVRIASNASNAVSFTVHLDRGWNTESNRYQDYSGHVGSDTIIMGGKAEGVSGVTWAEGARAVAVGGTVEAIGDFIVVRNATEAWIYIQIWTSYRQADPKAAVLSDLAAISQTYPEIRADHVADYQSYANRVELNFGNSTAAQRSMTTAKRMQTISNTSVFDPDIIALYFQMGRYLFISSSRNGTLPPNLQGIWNADEDPAWGSKYTVNINLEMNYWPALITNLADLISPLQDLIDKIHTTGLDTAKTMYGVGGFCCHHNTDMWGDTAPQDNYISSTFWPSAAPWLLFHSVLEYYRYTGDVEYLASQYQTLKDAAQFFVDFVTPWNDTWMVTNPTLSPENEYYLWNSTTEQAITAGSTIDNSLMWELFGALIEVQDIIKISDSEFAQTITALREKLPPLRESYFGGIMEWIEDYKETDPGHRHWSPIWGAFPGNQITPSNASTFNWAHTTFHRRIDNGGGSTGWSAAWAVALGARFFDKNYTNYMLMHLVGNLTYADSLLDTGPPAPFQIDGNFGGPSGIAECLLQSHENILLSSNGSDNGSLAAAYTGTLNKAPLIRLLPTLPPQWSASGPGYVKGLRARGGFEVSMWWDNTGSLTDATILSDLGGTFFVTLGSSVIGAGNATSIVVSGPGVVNATGGFVKVNSQKGQTYTVKLA